jgi:flagellum-specific peptidoglycan hydrolase FlgJ
MRTTITLLFLLLAFTSNGTDRGELLCNIKNDKVSKFINHIYTDAEIACKESGLPLGLLLAQSCESGLPLGLLLAQSCLESGYGQSNLAVNSCNFLGIRRNGKYCEYATPLECFRDWAKILRQKCYQQLKPTSLNIWLYLRANTTQLKTTRNLLEKYTTVTDLKY